MYRPVLIPTFTVAITRVPNFLASTVIMLPLYLRPTHEALRLALIGISRAALAAFDDSLALARFRHYRLRRRFETARSLRLIRAVTNSRQS